MNIIQKIFDKLFINQERIRLHLDDARKYEDEKQYENASYSYACAIMHGAREQIYKDKIMNIYKTHGSFTYETQLAKMKKEYCSSSESCGQGYHVGVVQVIADIIKAN